jgi:MFS family permease
VGTRKGFDNLWSALPDNFSALRHRDFRLFWVGALLSFFGTWIQNVGQGWLVFELTRSESLLGLLTLFSAGPMMILTPFGGWLADRFDKKVILTFTQSALALTALTLALAVHLGFASFPLIAGLAAISGTAAAIDIPTRQAMISVIVPKEDLANAVPLNAATFNLARLAGPAVGGFLLERYGAATCYFVNGISFLALIVAIRLIRTDAFPNSEMSGKMLENLKEGFQYVMNRRDFRLLTAMVFCTAFFGMFYLALLPALAKDKLGLGGNGLGMLMTSTGVGAVVGLLLLAGLSRLPQRGLLLATAMGGVGLGSLGLSLSARPWEAMVALAVLGAGGSMFLSGANATYQALCPPEIRGRVIALHIWAVAGANPLGAVLFGWVSERIGLEGAFAIGGSAVLGMSLAVYLFAPPIRELTV